MIERALRYLASTSSHKYFILYHVVVLATTSKIVYRDLIEDFYRLLANLQKKNFLAKRIFSRCNIVDTIDIFLLTLTGKGKLPGNSSK